MTGGNAPARSERSSEGKKQQFWGGPVPSEPPGVGGADANRPVAGAVCSSLARAAEPIPPPEDGAGRSPGAVWSLCSHSPQQTRTAVANARPIDDPQTAIAFSTVLMRDQDVACWASQGPIGLERKVGSCEAASFPGRRGGGWCIPRGRRRGRR